MQPSLVDPENLFRLVRFFDAGNTLAKGAGTVIRIISTGGTGLRLVERADSEYEYLVDNFRDADNETFGFGACPGRIATALTAGCPGTSRLLQGSRSKASAVDRKLHPHKRSSRTQGWRIFRPPSGSTVVRTSDARVRVRTGSISDRRQFASICPLLSGSCAAES
jgi:hypothetical protein